MLIGEIERALCEHNYDNADNVQPQLNGRLGQMAAQDIRRNAWLTAMAAADQPTATRLPGYECSRSSSKRRSQSLSATNRWRCPLPDSTANRKTPPHGMVGGLGSGA